LQEYTGLQGVQISECGSYSSKIDCWGDKHIKGSSVFVQKDMPTQRSQYLPFSTAISHLAQIQQQAAKLHA
jgi:hypothetical protein